MPNGSKFANELMFAVKGQLVPAEYTQSDIDNMQSQYIKRMWGNCERLPGTGSPLHIDLYSKIKTVTDKIGRWVIHLQDWNWGEFCQCDNRIMAGWNAGDAYQIPNGIPHLAVNYGIRNRNFFSVTGELRD